MSGHSKWSTIKRQKGVADIKRGQTFTKVANAITIAVKLGGSADAQSNPRLRMVIEEARTVNMPKENIQRAIDRGLGKLEGQVLEEVTFEGFGPGKTAFLVEAVTDNKLRTLQMVKNLFEKSGGNLGGEGSVAYMFSRLGELVVVSRGNNLDEEILELIDLGAAEVEDYVEDDKQKYLVYTQGVELNTMSNKITQAGYSIEHAELVYKPQILAAAADEMTMQKIEDFKQKLEELDDIQKIYINLADDRGGENG